MIYFTSDMHFGHKNIIEYCDRPFEDLTDMHTKLISNWNTIVKKDDIVFHLGDFCFNNEPEIYESKLNGRIMHIKGNHDEVKWYLIYTRINTYGLNIWMQHEPVERQEEISPDIHLILCGHVHKMWTTKIINCPDESKKISMINVGVDVHRYKPISIKEVVKIYNTIK